jgi:Protein of unknown function (DUF4240)
MAREEFWELINASRSIAIDHGQEAQIEWLTEQLTHSTTIQIKSFLTHWLTTMEHAYTWDLWGAAYLATGEYCSDDGFEYFRAWLILQGSDSFHKATAAPDSLADLDLPLEEAGQAMELPLGIARNAYMQIMGLDDPDDAEEIYDVCDNLNLSPHPRGPTWPTNAKGFRQRWPRLWAHTDHHDWTFPPLSSNTGHPGALNLVLPHDLQQPK